MDLISLITAIQQVPYIGPVVVYLPPLVLLGAIIATKLPAPATESSRLYRMLYAVVQWCALNKGEAANAAQPAPPPSQVQPAHAPVPAILLLGTMGALALSLAACAVPQTARQGIYQAAGAYDAALKTATAYARLPRCGQPASPPVCSDQALVTQASDAASTALPAVNAAIDTAANTSATDSVLSQALTAATNAVSAFTAIALKMGSN